MSVTPTENKLPSVDKCYHISLVRREITSLSIIVFKEWDKSFKANLHCLSFTKRVENDKA